MLCNNSFLFVVISGTVVQIVPSERKLRSNITVKNTLINNCSTMLDPTKKLFQLN